MTISTKELNEGSRLYLNEVKLEFRTEIILELRWPLGKGKVSISPFTVRKGVDTLVNIDIPGYKPFIFDATETSHRGTGFYIKESLQIKVKLGMI